MLHHQEAPSSVGSQPVNEKPSVAALNRGQPNVDPALNWGDAEAPHERKPTIGGRKPPAKKAGVRADDVTNVDCFYNLVYCLKCTILLLDSYMLAYLQM